MDKYFYLIAQLPHLIFDKPSFMNTDLFMEEAEKWMSGQDFKKLATIELMDIRENQKQSPIARKIQQFEKQLRHDLVEWRQSSKKNVEFKPMTFHVSMIKEGNPLEIEKKLLLLRWKYIESLEQDHHFDLDLLQLYYLKLQILQKLAEYDKQKGLERFQKFSKVTE